jgi:hypothetical protein
VNSIPGRQDALDDFAHTFLMRDGAEPNGNGHHTNGRASVGQLSDEEIIGLCRKAKNAAKFADLYDDGDVNRHHGGDESRADQTLASMLAFYTQENAQLERLISGSALGQRPKWKSRSDYRRRTIDKALNGVRETYTRHLAALSPSPSPISTNGTGDDHGWPGCRSSASRRCASSL